MGTSSEPKLGQACIGKLGDALAKDDRPLMCYANWKDFALAGIDSGYASALSFVLPTWQNSSDESSKGLEMSEPEQHDLAEEIAELSQSGGAVVEKEPTLHDPNHYTPQFVSLAKETPAPAPKRSSSSLLVLAGFGLLVVFVVILYLMTRPKPTIEPGDLGPGVSAGNGLRGHLVTRWEGKARDGKTLYQLRIEPMDMRPLNGAFSLVTTTPMRPIYMNVRLLDATGFALCGKQIIFAFDPAKAALASKLQSPKKGDASQVAAAKAANDASLQSQQAAEVERERGKDVFQNESNSDGQVTAVNAQGSLPCSLDQYKRADYWDFDTNFPTIAEQTALVDPVAARAQQQPKGPADEPRVTRRKAQKKPVSSFFIQGDDRITDYDASRGLLELGGKSFLIGNGGQADAARWASNYLLVHYKCDQHASCVLTAGGGTSRVNARLNE